MFAEQLSTWFAHPGLSVSMPTVAAMTQNIDSSMTTGSQSDTAPGGRSGRPG